MCTCVYMHMKAGGQAQVLPHEVSRQGLSLDWSSLATPAGKAQGLPPPATPALELK